MENKHGVIIENMDRDARPAQDFYQYAGGGWIKAHPLEGEYARYGLFDDLREKNRKQMRQLVDSLADNPQSHIKDTIAQKIHDLFMMGMDMARRNAEGADPLKPQIEHIEAAEPDKLIELIAWAHLGLTGSFFTSGVGANPADSNMNIMHLGEGGLGLGDRDYYLIDNAEHARIMTAYKLYIEELMWLAGLSPRDGRRIRENVIAIETRLAECKKTREERRNPQLSFNPRTMEQLEQEMPAIPWRRYFEAVGIPALQSLNIGSLNYLKKLNEYLPALSPRAIKDYIIFQAVDAATGLLSDDFRLASFRMYDVTMSGIEEEEPLWKRALAIPSSMLGQALGKLYVEKFFPPQAKEKMLELVENLRKALASHINRLPWMGDKTKAKALEKLRAMTVKIGYPDKWKDYSGIHIDPEKSYLENVYEASKWYVRDNYSKLDKPVDKNEWLMAPQAVNAYYAPIYNDLCFPAGILQPPYFDLSADDALNYGGIGVVIGHEMTHGFDDQGRQFDAQGNLLNWWEDDDAKAFNALADKLAAQFDAIEVAPGVNANGRFTLGENIADQGGLSIALTAYENSNSPGLKHDIDGFSPVQRFFIAYAQLWAESIRAEEVLQRVKTDPHSLGRQRVNATLRNLTAFHEAFNLETEDALFLAPTDRILIW